MLEIIPYNPTLERVGVSIYDHGQFSSHKDAFWDWVRPIEF